MAFKVQIQRFFSQLSTRRKQSDGKETSSDDDEPRTLLADKIHPVTTELKLNAVLFAFEFVMP